MKSPFLRRFGMPSPFFDNEAGFSPSALLAGSTALVWLDPSDLTTLFQDAAGTTPVTAPGQPVGLALDKSQGLTLGPELVNGDGTSLTGWVVGFSSGGAFALSNGAFEITRTTTNFASRSYPFPTVVGRWYRASADYLGGTGDGRVIVSDAPTNFDTVRRDITPGVGATPAQAGTYSRYFQATATTTHIHLLADDAVNEVSRYDNISVRELPGFHATASGTSRPTYGVVPSRGRVNLLTRTEEFDNAYWTAGNVIVTANNSAAPDETTTAEKIAATATQNNHIIQAVSGPTLTSGLSYSVSVYAKAAGYDFVQLTFAGATHGSSQYANFNLATGAVGNNSGGSASIVPVGSGWYRCTWTATATATAATGPAIVVMPSDTATRLFSFTGDGTSGIFIWGAQLELGSTATPYQRVGSAFDVTDPVGFPSYPCHYLQFDGVDDFMQTPTITPNADKAQVFAGVRKLSDANAAIVAEFGTGVGGQNGTFLFGAPGDNGVANYVLYTRGTSPVTLKPTGFTAPITNVATVISDISGDLARVRINGSQVAQSTADQGTGNYLAYPLFIGRRAGTSLPFNGQLFSLIVRFSTANLDASLISQTERWMGGKTGVTIA